MGSPPFPRRSKPDDACAKRGGQRFYGEPVPGLRQRRRGGKRQGEHQCCGTAEEPVLKHERTPLIDVPAQSAGNDFVLP